jgi:hypothetical protein
VTERVVFGGAGVLRDSRAAADICAGIAGGARFGGGRLRRSRLTSHRFPVKDARGTKDVDFILPFVHDAADPCNREVIRELSHTNLRNPVPFASGGRLSVFKSET